MDGGCRGKPSFGKVSFIDIVVFVFLQSYILCFLFWLCSYRGTGTGPSSDGFMEAFYGYLARLPAILRRFYAVFLLLGRILGNKCLHLSLFRPFSPVFTPSCCAAAPGTDTGTDSGNGLFLNSRLFLSIFVSFFLFLLPAGR